MGTIFSIHAYEATTYCLYHEGYIDRINLLKPQSKHPVCIAIMGLPFGGHLPIKGYVWYLGSLPLWVQFANFEPHIWVKRSRVASPGTNWSVVFI